MRVFAALYVSSVIVMAQDPPKLRLPDSIRPIAYSLDLKLTPSEDTFTGAIDIEVEVRSSADLIWLNGSNLTIASATIGSQQARVVGGGTEFIGLAVATPVPTGRTRIAIKYSGVLNKNDVEGLFKQREGGDDYIFTQFAATAARKAFPSFDEPNHKTPWRITLRVPSGLKAFANTPVKSQKSFDGLTVYEFVESKPLPTYLVAMAVGPFDVVDGGVAGKNKIPLRVIAPRGRGSEAAWTTEVTPKVFSLLEEYFGTPYPFEKLDQAAIPVTVGFGAMENAGLITYAQTLLLGKKEDDTIERRRSVAATITHELAHQWFGNMVTPSWWDDIWLNEAFATWITTKIVDGLAPHWNAKVAAAETKQTVMATDELVTARKIRQPIVTHGDIGNAFDGITYRKGAAVIRMFEVWLGPDVFRRGVQSYMRKHTWGNATTDDFLTAIGTTAKKDVKAAFSTFLDRNGVPLISVALDCKSGAKPKVTLSQQRSLPLGSAGSREEYWQLPVCVKYENGKTTPRQCMLLTDPKDTMTLEAASGCPEWVYANDDASGYYRVRYEGELAGKVSRQIKKLAVNEQVDFVKNFQGLMNTGQIRAEDALALLPSLKDSTDRELVTAAVSIASSVHRSVPEELKPKYAKFIRDMFGTRARSLGWTANSGDTEEDRLLRPLVLYTVALRGEDTELIAQAKQLAETYLTTRQGLPPEMMAPVLAVAARNGDRKFYDQLIGAAKSTSDRLTRMRLIAAIGNFNDPHIVRSALSLLLTSDFDIRDLLMFIDRRVFQDDPKTEHLTWEFVKANYDKLVPRLPSQLGVAPAAILPNAAAYMCDEKGRDEVASFFRDRFKDVSGGDRSLRTVLETIELCGPRRAAQRPGVEKFLREY